MSEQSFVQGSTVRLVVRVSEPDTDRPKDVDEVVLTALTGQSTLAQQFTRISEGLYERVVDSQTLTPGTYWWKAVAIEDGVGNSVIEDSFVVAAPH